MTANTSPIFTLTPNVTSTTSLVNAVNASLYNGAGTIGTDVYLVWTAGANGGYLQRARVKYVANATTTSVACIMKFFLTNASSGSVTDANMWFIDEISIPATGTLSTTTTAAIYEVPFNFALPAGMSLAVKITVAQGAGTGFVVTGIGGSY